MKNTLTSLSLTTTLLMSGVAYAARSIPVTLDVDAADQCLHVAGGGTSSYVPLGEVLRAGKYMVTVIASNANYCGGGPGCNVPKVAFFATTVGNPAGWFGVADGDATIFSVPKDDTVFAFVPDDYCADNTGSTVVQFTLMAGGKPGGRP